jgi:hypothetical protein
MREEARQLTLERFELNENGKKKTCKCCGHLRKLSSFYRDSGYKDGHDSVCKCCRKPQKMSTMRRYRKKKADEARGQS